MTDKVQKIREEVERLQNELIQEKKKGFGSDVDDACILELQNVLTYIDSLQEEPVSNIWHDAKLEQPQAKEIIIAINEFGTCRVDNAINMALYLPKVIKWAYISELLKL